jgi:hypothetical protein
MVDNKKGENIEKHFRYIINSQEEPYIITTRVGITMAAGPMEALEKILREYKAPDKIYSALVEEILLKPAKARYLSARAATHEAAPEGLREWKNDGLYVDGKKVPEKEERYEIIEK